MRGMTQGDPAPRVEAGADERLMRGLHRLPDPAIWGAVVGAVGASVFVNAYRGVLPQPVSLAAMALWLVELVVFAWALLVRPRLFPDRGPVPRNAPFVYVGSVVAMIALIQVGRIVLDLTDRPLLLPTLIVLAVGTHFLPFAQAFRAPMFTTLGIVMVTAGVLGLGLGLVLGSWAAAGSAVVAGLAMLAVITQNALRPLRS